MAKTILAWNERAQQYQREIGKLPTSGKPHRFYLTDDERVARANVVRLEGFWQGVKDRWNELNASDLADTATPVWDDTTLKIGTAVGKGLFFLDLDPPDDIKDDDDLATWIADLRDYFPQIQIRLKPEVAAAAKAGVKERLELAKKEAEEEQARHRKTMRELRDYAETHEGKIRTQETLHDALDAYRQWIERTFVDVEGRTTQTGKKQGERAVRIKKYAKDMPLSEFETPQIESIIEFWRTRPRKPPTKKKPGGPYAFTLCKHTIRLFKHFLRWLHKEPTFPWKKPGDLDLGPILVVRDTEIKYKVETYSKEEVRILWQHASHFERRLLLLRLNCGFSISEIGSLDWQEVEGQYIKGLRPKTKVYGEFKMWDITRETFGTPPRGRADYAFLQHIVASLKPKTGRCSILFPHGVLFRDEEQAMREKLIEADKVECVLGLGPNLFYGSPMEACILICRANKPKERRGKVLFINAVNEVTRERSQSFLKPDQLDRILQAYRGFADVDGFCRVATLDEIRANRANLNIPLYVRQASVGREFPADDLRKTIAEWRASSQQIRLSFDGLVAILEGKVATEDRDTQ